MALQSHHVREVERVFLDDGVVDLAARDRRAEVLVCLPIGPRVVCSRLGLRMGLISRRELVLLDVHHRARGGVSGDAVGQVIARALVHEVVSDWRRDRRGEEVWLPLAHVVGDVPVVALVLRVRGEAVHVVRVVKVAHPARLRWG